MDIKHQAVDEKNLQKFLEENPISNKCPLCGNSSLTIDSSYVWQLTPYTPNAFTVGGPFMPLIPIICMKCGNTMFINALLNNLLVQTDKNEQGGNTNG